jgi:hypothetical protein
MKLDAVNELFVELSQFATASTDREVELEDGIRKALEHCHGDSPVKKILRAVLIKKKGRWLLSNSHS